MLSGYSEAVEATGVRGTQTGQTSAGPQHNMTTVTKLRTKVNISKYTFRSIFWFSKYVDKTVPV